jgi:hypothetical protein
LFLFEAFQVKALAKLDTLLENQQEQLNILRQLAASSTVNVSGECIEDLLPRKMETDDELQNINNLLTSPEYKKKLVRYIDCCIALTDLTLQMYASVLAVD